MIFTYDPKKVDLLVAGYKLPGLVEISVQFASRPFKKIKGIRGTNTRIRDMDSSCTIQITVLQTSLTNNVLSKIHELDAQFGTGRLELSLQDNSGTTGTKTLVESDTAFIDGFPDFTLTNDSSTRVWTIHCLSTRNVHVGSGFKPGLDIFG